MQFVIVLLKLCSVRWHSPGFGVFHLVVLPSLPNPGRSRSHVWSAGITDSSVFCFSHSSLFRPGLGTETLFLVFLLLLFF